MKLYFWVYLGVLKGFVSCTGPCDPNSRNSGLVPGNWDPNPRDLARLDSAIQTLRLL